MELLTREVAVLMENALLTKEVAVLIENAFVSQQSNNRLPTPDARHHKGVMNHRQLLRAEERNVI